jgi:hypothetical protein
MMAGCVLGVRVASSRVTVLRCCTVFGGIFQSASASVSGSERIAPVLEKLQETHKSALKNAISAAIWQILQPKSAQITQI